MYVFFFLFFCFKQKTAYEIYQCDWSSDVCSSDLIEAFMAGPDDALGVKEVEDPRRFGVVETENGWVKRVIEKPQDPPTNLAVVGLYGIKNTSLLNDCLQIGRASCRGRV